MALTPPMSLKLILRGPVVHTVCHTTLSLQPSSNGDLFLPQRATTDFSHYRDHTPPPSAVHTLHVRPITVLVANVMFSCSKGPIDINMQQLLVSSGGSTRAEACFER